MTPEERAYFRANAHRLAPCSCGGPAGGTDHAPDCTYVRSMDDLAEDWRDEQAEREDN